jgi:hypothetical protein
VAPIDGGIVEQRNQFSNGDDLRLYRRIRPNFSPLLLWVLAAKVPIRAGLASTLKHKSGAMSYWALDHATKKPDFHETRTFGVLI